MINRSNSRGEGQAGCIFWLVILAAFVFIGWQVIPLKINTSDLQEFIVRQAESAGNSPAAQIHKEILQRAKDLDLPVTKENLLVKKGNGRIIIECEYELPITLMVYTYNWKVRHNIDRPFFLL